MESGRLKHLVVACSLLAKDESPSYRSVTHHLREVLCSSRGAKDDKEGCPRCHAPWSRDQVTLKFMGKGVGARKSGAGPRSKGAWSLHKLLRADPASLNTFQASLVNKIKTRQSFSRLKLTCLECKEVTTYNFPRTARPKKENNVKKEEVAQKEDEKETPDKKKKRKRKKDSLCGLKRRAVAQVKLSRSGGTAGTSSLLKDTFRWDVLDIDSSPVKQKQVHSLSSSNHSKGMSDKIGYINIPTVPTDLIVDTSKSSLGCGESLKSPQSRFKTNKDSIKNVILLSQPSNKKCIQLKSNCTDKSKDEDGSINTQPIICSNFESKTVKIKRADSGKDAVVGGFKLNLTPFETQLSKSSKKDKSGRGRKNKHAKSKHKGRGKVPQSSSEKMFVNDILNLT